MVTQKTSPDTTNEYYGISTDTKPTDAPNASTFYEMDTQKLYMFDVTNSTWIEQ